MTKGRKKSLLHYLGMLAAVFVLVTALVYDREVSALKDFREGTKKRKPHIHKAETHQERVLATLGQISQKLKMLETEIRNIKKEFDLNKTRRSS